MSRRDVGPGESARDLGSFTFTHEVAWAHGARWPAAASRNRPKTALSLLTTRACPSPSGACVGSIGDATDSEKNGSTPPGTTKAPVDCSVPHAGTSPVRRLTGEEYDNTVRDLLGDATQPSNGFIQDGSTGTFKSNAESPVTALLAVQYGDAAERLATTAVAQLDKLVSCNADAAIAKDDCAMTFVSSFGKRAYRRPLTTAERDRLYAFYKSERTAGTDFKTAIRLVVQAMLQSPNFLNHVERGVASVTPAGDTVPLTQHEMASRLSYLLWKTMPDPALMTAADNGELSSPDALESQARRMLKDDRGRAGVKAFYREWLELDLAPKMTKKPEAFPDFSAEVGKAMKDETEAFVHHVLFDGDRRLDTLLTASFSFVNEPLAKVYGLPGITGMALRKVNLDPAQRSGGVLTQLSFLAGHAHTEQTSPVKRGKFVRERLLCQEMPSPPATVDVTPPKPDPLLTTRETLFGAREEPLLRGLPSSDGSHRSRLRGLRRGWTVSHDGERVEDRHLRRGRRLQ